MAIKPLYLLADSQLLFWKQDDSWFSQRIRDDAESQNPKAAYLGASNGDDPEFYALFLSAMDLIGIHLCRHVRADPSPADLEFLAESDIVLLAGGDPDLGWQAFQRNGVKDLLLRKRLDGCVMVGVSAGAVQFGLGVLSASAQPRKIDMFRFAPFYVGAHEEKEEWWNLSALVRLGAEGEKGIGIPAGAGAIYQPDGTLEPVRKPLFEFEKRRGQSGAEIHESLLVPPGT